MTPPTARAAGPSRLRLWGWALALAACLSLGPPMSQPVTGWQVDGVGPRPRLFFAPGEYARFLAELDGPRRPALDRLLGYIDGKRLDSWNERDLQLESHALVARALLDRGDPRGQRYLDYARNSLRRFLPSHTYERFSDSHDVVTEGYRWLEAVALAHDWLHPRWTDAERQEMANWLRDEINHWVDRDRLRRASPSPFRNDAARGVQGLLAASLTLFDEPGYRAAAERGIRYAWPYYEAILAAHEYAGRGGGMAEGTFYGNLTGWSQTVIAELLFTGAGQRDAYTRSPFYANRLSYAIHASWPGYLTNQFRSNVHQLAPVFGDARRGPTGSALFHRATVLLLGKRFAGTPAAGHAYAVVNRPETDRTYVAEWGLYDLLLWSPEVQPREPTALSYREPSLGQVFARSDWSDAATWLSFNAGPHLDTHQHYDAGNLTLFRNVDLAVDSGSFDGFGSSHWYNYYARTVAHNTITVTDPTERWEGIWGGVPDNLTANDGGQRTAAPLTPAPTLDGYLANRTAYDHGRIDRYAAGAWGVYVRADLTNAYQNPAYQSARPNGTRNRPKVTHVGREVLYLRRSPGRRDAVIVFDRVVSTDPSFRKAVLWHAREPFQTGLAGRTVDEGEKVFEAASQYTFETTVAFDERSRRRDGKLFVTALALDPVRVRQIGARPATETADHSPSGDGHFHRHVKDFFVNDPQVVNPRRTTGTLNRPEWPPASPQEEAWLFNDDLAGGWGKTRLEIEPAAARQADRFVSVLVPTDAGDGTRPRLKLVDNGGAAAVLRLEGGRAEVVIFSADPNGGALPATSFRLPLPDADVYVADLEPGTSYAITTSKRVLGYELSIRPGSGGIRADASGLLRFRLRDPAGAVAGGTAAAAAAAPAGVAASLSAPAAGSRMVTVAPNSADELHDWNAQIDAMLRSGELVRVSSMPDPHAAGRRLERFAQVHDGAPVVGAELVRQSAGPTTRSVLGRLYDDPNPAPVPDLSAQELRGLAVRALGEALAFDGEPVRVYLPGANGLQPGYAVLALTVEGPRTVLIDVRTRRVTALAQWWGRLPAEALPLELPPGLSDGITSMAVRGTARELIQALATGARVEAWPLDPASPRGAEDVVRLTARRGSAAATRVISEMQAQFLPGAPGTVSAPVQLVLAGDQPSRTSGFRIGPRTFVYDAAREASSSGPSRAVVAQLLAESLIDERSGLLARGDSGSLRQLAVEILAGTAASGSAGARGTPSPAARAFAAAAADEQGAASAAHRLQIERIFVRALVLLVPPDADVELAAAATVQAARDLHGSDSAMEAVIRRAWSAARGAR